MTAQLADRLEGRFLRENERIWRSLPDSIRDSTPLTRYGVWLHQRVSRRADRQMYLGTQFLRNRPALELIRRRLGHGELGRPARIAVLGCSIGAEVYSTVWVLRSDQPKLELTVVALDIAPAVVRFAEAGIYSPEASEMVRASIFKGLTDRERTEMFDWDGSRATIKQWLRSGIDWQVGDASDPDLLTRLGPQDLVVASNFLCHMPPATAERCLRNLSRLVAPGGYLFVSGVSLDVRTRVAGDLGWEPVAELRAEIHDGDPLVRADWPWRWWGLEPLDRRRADCEMRYTAVFQIRNSAP